MFIDMGLDWNHLLTLAAIGTAILAGALAGLCAAAGLCARLNPPEDRKPRSQNRMTV